MLGAEDQRWREVMVSHPFLLRVRDISLRVTPSPLKKRPPGSFQVGQKENERRHPDDAYFYRKGSRDERQAEGCLLCCSLSSQTRKSLRRAVFLLGWGEKKPNPFTAPAGKGKNQKENGEGARHVEGG